MPALRRQQSRGVAGFPLHGVYGISLEKPSLEWPQTPFGDRTPEVGHQPEEEVNVVQAEEPERQQLLGDEEVAEIRARKSPTRVAATTLLERPGVTGVLRMLDHERAIGGEALAVAGGPGGEHAIEENHALADRPDPIPRPAPAPEITRLRPPPAPAGPP